MGVEEDVGVRGDDQAQNEEVDDVEEAAWSQCSGRPCETAHWYLRDTPEDLSSCLDEPGSVRIPIAPNFAKTYLPRHITYLGDRLQRILSLSSSEATELSASESEGGCDEHRAEPFEPVPERTRILPILPANVSSVVSRYATTIDDNTQDNESRTRQNLHHTQHKLDLTIASHAEELHRGQYHEEDGNPDSNIDISSTGPERNRETGCRDFEW